MKEKIIQINSNLLRLFFLALYYLGEIFSNLFKHFPTINLYQGIMCRVLHMARCTNVATFGILPLHSEVVRGIAKDEIIIDKKLKG
jgi:hypothetical protein